MLDSVKNALLGFGLTTLLAASVSQYFRAEHYKTQLLEERNARALATIKALDVARAEEARRAEDSKGIDREMSNYRARLEADRAKAVPALAASADRLRVRAEVVAGGCSLPANPAPAEHRENPASALADVLGACAAEHTRMANEADAEVDKLRAASLECERRYESLTGGEPAP